ncbi:MAG: ATP-binding protein [Candidatus Woesearchaeota archaeon]
MPVFDISQLSENNPWWVDKNNILNDLKISDLQKLDYQWDPNIRHYIRLENDVLFTIRGPRQVGKTTLMKIIIKDLLLNKKINAENVFFWSFENNTSDELNQIIKTYLDWRSSSDKGRKYLFLDEICAVKNWSKGLIHFANKGSFKNCSIVVTGSHSMDLKHSTELMPGRRGGDDKNPLDKILLPMKFSEFVMLLWPEFKKILFDLDLIKKEDKHNKLFELFKGNIDKSIQTLSIHKKQLDSLFEMYLLTGGIPSTINEFKKKNNISTNLFNVYLNSIIGDLNRYNYKELFFKQIIRETFNTLSNPISWNSFIKKTSIKSHNTIQDYITAMEELYIANISYRCSIHDKRIHSFMKKIYILDPFIFHALHGWSNAKKDYFSNAKANLLNLETKSKLVESVVYNHLCRFSYGINPRDLFDPKDHICYYEDKNKKEVDFVLIYDDNYYPFEVKYQASISSSDFFAFKSFKRGVLISKNKLDTYRDYVQIPISLFLMLI